MHDTPRRVDELLACVGPRGIEGLYRIPITHQLPVTGTFVRVLKYEKLTLVAKGEI